MNAVHKLNYESGKHVKHPLMSERHNDVTNVITQKSRLKYDM